jgi:prepilin-type N-terminal cleavage/methylation domain-containing protein
MCARGVLVADTAPVCSSARIIRSQRGSSLIEMMLVVGIMGVVTAIAMGEIGSSRPYMIGDGAMRTVIAQMNTARELSITQRRSIQLTFVGNVITLIRQNVAVGTAPATTTVLAAIPMEGGVQFGLTTGVPDTPEGFGLLGSGAAAYFGTATTSVFFTSDGSLISGAGVPVSGTVFLTLPNQPRGTRAVTVFGATGRIRGYKWDGGHWVRA